MKKFTLTLFVTLLAGIQMVLAQDIRVTGTVVDDSGSPMIGVTVIVEGTSRGTATLGDGSYSITAPTNGNLNFSFVGMVPVTIPVQGRTVINVDMKTDAETIDNVVVIGYGSGRSLGSMVGSVASVGGEKLANLPASNVTDALQGQVAGLQVFSSSGEPSATNTMRIRGVSSINASTTPLYLLDGVPITATAFTMMNPNDVENITILKDAASTAIYGSRAANGVVYVTSKKGRRDWVEVTVTAQTGFSKRVDNQLKLMNAQQMFQFEEMVMPDLVDNRDYQLRKDIYNQNNLSFDWEKYMYDTSAPMHDLGVSVRGGNEKTRYMFSIGYRFEDGTTPRSERDLYTARLNLDTDVNKWLRMGVNTSLSYQKSQQSSKSWSVFNPAMVVNTNPSYYAPYEMLLDDNNKFLGWGDRYDVYPWNEVVDSHYFYENHPSKTDHANLNLSLFQEIRPIEGLTIRFQQSVDAIDTRASASSLPTFVQNVDKDGITNGNTERLFGRHYLLLSTNTIDYSRTFWDDHNFTLLLGQEATVSREQRTGLAGEGLTDDRLLLLSSADPDKIFLTLDTDQEYVFNSYFSRFSYMFQDKYFFDATIRRDGSSRFGKDNRWGTFWSVGGMWNAKEENFLRNVNWLDQLRVRVNYGTTGNASLGGNYRWAGSVGTAFYNGQAGTGLATPGNNNLTWETVASFTAGIEARLMNRFDVNVEFYNKKTTDMLMNIPYSATTGFSGGWGNVGSMRNRGVEVTLGVDILNTKDFTWNVSFNASYNKNKITELYGDVDEFVDGTKGLVYKVGHSAGEFRYVRRVGVDPADGNPVYLTKNDEYTKIYSDDDAVMTGASMFPEWSGGFSTGFRWKDLSLSATFSFVGDKYIWLNEKLYTMSTTYGQGRTQRETKMLNIWTKPGDITDIPRWGTQFQFDSSVYENASFFRMKNLTLAYTLPEKWMKATGFMNRCKVYVQGYNLWTITKYHGVDPELDSNGSQGVYANPKRFMFGIELTF